MLGVRVNVFNKNLGNSLLKYWWRRIKHWDERTGMISAAIPLSITMVAGITVSTIILDRQFELRDLRQRSISHREATLEQEHQALREFLSKTEDEYEMKA